MKNLAYYVLGMACIYAPFVAAWMWTGSAIVAIAGFFAGMIPLWLLHGFLYRKEGPS